MECHFPQKVSNSKGLHWLETVDWQRPTSQLDMGCTIRLQLKDGLDIMELTDYLNFDSKKKVNCSQDPRFD